MTGPSTAARLAHDLGLAVCFGGTLFGKVVFNPSVVVASKPERGRVGGTTWNRFNVLNAASFALAATAWLPGRLELAGDDESDRSARNLLLAKDVLMGVAASTGLAALIVQVVLYRQAPGGAVPQETGSVPAPEASDRASRLQRAVSALGSANAALFAALIATTTLLSTKVEGSAHRGRAGRPR